MNRDDIRAEIMKLVDQRIGTADYMAAENQAWREDTRHDEQYGEKMGLVKDLRNLRREVAFSAGELADAVVKLQKQMDEHLKETPKPVTA